MPNRHVADVDKAPEYGLIQKSKNVDSTWGLNGSAQIKDSVVCATMQKNSLDCINLRS